MKIGVLLGSVRHGRKGVAVADWILRNAGPRAASYELIDLVDHVLPHLAEPTPPRVGQYTLESTTAWSAVIQGFDTFIVVTPEYNGGIPGVLKNAFDHLYREWSGKPVGLGYGFGGGSGDLSQLEALVAELGMVRVAPRVELMTPSDFEVSTGSPLSGLDGQLEVLLDALEATGGPGLAGTPLASVSPTKERRW